MVTVFNLLSSGLYRRLRSCTGSCAGLPGIWRFPDQPCSWALPPVGNHDSNEHAANL